MNGKDVLAVQVDAKETERNEISTRTVDFVAIGQRSVNYLTRIASSAEDYIPFFGVKFPWRGVPYMIHSPWDYGDGVGRILEALVFVRRMTGCEDNLDVQRKLVERLCSLYDEDGITYREVTPWSTRVSGPYELRSSTLALTALVEDGRHDLEPLLASAVDGIARVFSTEQIASASGVWDGKRWTGERFIGVEIGAGLPVIDALVRCYLVTGNTKALDTASRIVEHYFFGPEALFQEDGSFSFPGDAEPKVELCPQSMDYVPSMGHFHTRTCGVAGLARYGAAAGDRRCVELARKIHDHMLSYGTSFGWFPENLFTDGREVSEMCDTLDMIELELLLSGQGHTELYDSVERFAKNHVAANQFIPDQMVRDSLARTHSEVVDETGQRCYRDVLERAAGGFVCVCYPDDVYTCYPHSRFDLDGKRLIDISGCCSGSGAKATYVAWLHSIEEGDDAIRINYPTNRKHPALDMTCREEDECIVELRSRSHKPVKIRIPRWTRANLISITSRGLTVPQLHTGEWIVLEPQVCKDKTVELQIPMLDRTETCQVAGLEYEVDWHGNLVRQVTRADGDLPLRNHYKHHFVF